MSVQSLDKFVRLLKQSPPGAVFNPWWQVDRQNDIGRNAPAIRRRHLGAYLHKRLGKVQLVVIGEALGYRGGHFTGIPMTSERILLGKKKDSGIEPEQVFSSIKARRTSKARICPSGFSEATATIVWSALLKLGLKPEQFVLWNAFPWRGSRWANLLLRSLRAHRRQNDVEGSSLTRRRSDNSNNRRNASSVVGICFTAKVDDSDRASDRASSISLSLSLKE